MTRNKQAPSVPRNGRDPRPGGRPYYIENVCETCGGPLAYWHVVAPPDPNPWTGKIDPCYDEFACAAGCEGVYADLPAAVAAAFMARLRAACQGPAHSWEKWRYLKRTGQVDDNYERRRVMQRRKRRR